MRDISLFSEFFFIINGFYRQRPDRTLHTRIERRRSNRTAGRRRSADGGRTHRTADGRIGRQRTAFSVVRSDGLSADSAQVQCWEAWVLWCSTSTLLFFSSQSQDLFSDSPRFSRNVLITSKECSFIKGVVHWIFQQLYFSECELSRCYLVTLLPLFSLSDFLHLLLFFLLKLHFKDWIWKLKMIFN